VGFNNIWNMSAMKLVQTEANAVDEDDPSMSMESSTLVQVVDIRKAAIAADMSPTLPTMDM